MIEFSNVTFNYPSRPNQLILDSVNLTLQPGKVVALVGPSGGGNTEKGKGEREVKENEKGRMSALCEGQIENSSAVLNFLGKTTIAKLLLGLYHPSKGSITINGVNINSYDPRLWRRKFGTKFPTFYPKISILRFLGVVNQEPSLFATTIEKNILYALDSVSDDEVKAFSFKNYNPPSLEEIEKELEIINSSKPEGDAHVVDPFDLLLEDKTVTRKEKLRLCQNATKSANAFDFIENLQDKYSTMVGEKGARLSGKLELGFVAG